MALRFEVALTGFSGQTLQVWAGPKGGSTQPLTCLTDATRGTSCWMVASPVTGLGDSEVVTVDVRVQDLVGYQGSLPTAGTYAPLGSKACTAQLDPRSSTHRIWFVPVDASGAAEGTPYMYQITTDLVGPPAPATQALGIGDTMLVAQWTPNTEGDTIAYDIFLDPLPGQPGSIVRRCLDGRRRADRLHRRGERPGCGFVRRRRFHWHRPVPHRRARGHR